MSSYDTAPEHDVGLIPALVACAGMIVVVLGLTVYALAWVWTR